MINLYHRVFALYRPNLPFIARVALFHLVLFAVLSVVLYVGDLLEYLVFGYMGWPAIRVNSVAGLFGRAVDCLDYLDLFYFFDWYHGQEDLLEFDWMYKLVLCALAGWGTWKMVGRKMLQE